MDRKTEDCRRKIIIKQISDCSIELTDVTTGITIETGILDNCEFDFYQLAKDGIDDLIEKIKIREDNEFNGRVVCINEKYPYSFKKGKIYSVNNGLISSGDYTYNFKKSEMEINGVKFIQIVE